MSETIQNPKAALDRLVERFLSWHLPNTVQSDSCVTLYGYAHTRTGTNLLSATEARQMIEHLMAADVFPYTQAELNVFFERRRQVTHEGFTSEHDDKEGYGELALAAAAYAAESSERGRQGDVFVGRGQIRLRSGWFNLPALLWPWERHWWKPGDARDVSDRRRMLVKAAALIVAEIERLDRVAAKAPLTPEQAAD